jgi:hypothetical protein
MKWLNLVIKNVMLPEVNKKTSLLHNNELQNCNWKDYILKNLFL